MSHQAKKELLIQIIPRYREASRNGKTAILDAYVAATGYDRKYATRLFNRPAPTLAGPIKRPRARCYGRAVQDALIVAWQASNCICAKRLVPFLPELVESLERHGHLQVTDEVRSQLLTLSMSTADRILSERCGQNGKRGATTTRPGTLLKHQVPIRTFADWCETEPGFFEADLVAHCGTSIAGAFLWSLVLTDITTGWTECLALRHRSEDAVIEGLKRLRQLLPFPLLGFDTDNGGEFINYAMLAYCEREQITFTRGRVARKNDQCYVEQKNGSIVRQLVGYDRYEGEVAYRQLAELYRAVRLYVNFFQPSMKLQEKQRHGSRVKKRYDEAQTPFQRLLASNLLDETRALRLKQVYRTLDPVQLLKQIRVLQDGLWRHAVQLAQVNDEGTPESSAVSVAFDLQACLSAGNLIGDNGNLSETAIEILGGPSQSVQKRKYHRKKKHNKPRTYRTRKDPFEEVKDDLYGWFLEAPESTGKMLLQKLQQHYPGRYPDSQLRTLQRRLRGWRQEVIFEFDDSLIREDVALTQSLAPQVRAVPLDQLGHTDATKQMVSD